jgi:hypothetical protein
VGLSTFYTAHWQTYVTGALKFGYVDVTEAQAIVCTIFALTGIFGDALWAYKLPILNFELRYIPAVTGTIGSFASIFRNLTDISKGGKGKNGSSVAVNKKKSLINSLKKKQYFKFLFIEHEHCVSGLSATFIRLHGVLNRQQLARRLPEEHLSLFAYVRLGLGQNNHQAHRT